MFCICIFKRDIESVCIKFMRKEKQIEVATERLLERLNHSRSLCPDVIHPWVPKEHKCEIADFFTKYVKLDSVRHDWKIAKVTSF